MSRLVLALALAASPGAPIELVAPGLSPVNLSPEMASFFSNSLAQQLVLKGVRVKTSDDLRALIGHERQRKLLGCPDDVCRASVLQDIESDGLLTGQVVKLEREHRVEVRVLDTRTGKGLAAATATAPDADALVRTLADVAERLSTQLASTLGRDLLPDTSRATTRWSTTRRLGWLPFSLGVLAAGAGAVSLGLAHGSYGTLTSGQVGTTQLAPAEADALVASGKLQQTLGWVGLGVGGAALAAGALLLAFGGEETVLASVGVSHQGAFVGVRGTF